MLKYTLLIALGASPALADDPLMFQSPSGNIACMIGSGDDAGARCDIFDFTRNHTDFPEGCDLDWGDSFAIAPRDGQGALVCHGDTVADPSAMVLPYGDQISRGDITCASAETGMSCFNAEGHGFRVSKVRQDLF